MKTPLRNPVIQAANISNSYYFTNKNPPCFVQTLYKRAVTPINEIREQIQITTPHDN